MFCAVFVLVLMLCAFWMRLLHLDFDVATGWQAQIHEAVNGLGRGLEHIYKALMYAHFKLFAALFVHVRAFYDRVGTLACRQRNWPSQGSASAQCGVYNLLGGLVYNLVVISLKAYTNTLFYFGVFGVSHIVGPLPARPG